MKRCRYSESLARRALFPMTDFLTTDSLTLDTLTIVQISAMPVGIAVSFVFWRFVRFIADSGPEHRIK